MAVSKQEYQAQVQRYMELLRQGIPAAQAYGQAFPNGIPTAEDAAKQQAKDQQKGAMGQIGGMVGGVVGTKAIYDAVTGQPILGGVGAKIANALGLGGGEAATTAATNTVAAPELLAVNQVGGGAPVAEAASLGYAPYLGVAGAGLGAYGLYNAIKGNDAKAGALSGAALGGGLAAASPLLLGAGPVGWGVLGASALGGALLGGGLTKAIGDKDMWKTEGNRMRNLQEQGYSQLPVNMNPLTKGQSKGDLIKAAEASGNQDAIMFAKTRDEKYISPEALSTHAKLIELAGKQAGQAERFKLAQEAVAAHRAGFNVLKEHHGTIDVNADQLAQYRASLAQPQPGQQPPTITPIQDTPINRRVVAQNGQFGNQLLAAMGA